MTRHVVEFTVDAEGYVCNISEPIWVRPGDEIAVSFGPASGPPFTVSQGDVGAKKRPLWRRVLAWLRRCSPLDNQIDMAG